MNTRPEVPAYALAGLLVAAIAALAGLHTDVPSVLPYALLAVLGVAGGVSLPLGHHGEPLNATQSPQPAAPEVIPAPPVSVPAVVAPNPPVSPAPPVVPPAAG